MYVNLLALLNSGWLDDGRYLDILENMSLGIEYESVDGGYRCGGGGNGNPVGICVMPEMKPEDESDIGGYRCRGGGNGKPVGICVIPGMNPEDGSGTESGFLNGKLIFITMKNKFNTKIQ